MLKMVKYVMIMMTMCFIAFGGRANADELSVGVDFSRIIRVDPIEKFMDMNLFNDGNIILHGYVPHEGDIVEWYVRGVDCVDPAKSCRFELAIRKKECADDYALNSLLSALRHRNPSASRISADGIETNEALLIEAEATMELRKRSCGQ